MKVTNNSKALQGVNTLSGVVYLQPGESRELDFNDAELAGIKRLAFIGIEGLDRGASYPPKENGQAPLNGTEKPAADTPSEREELKKQADELGIEYARNITTDKLKELIDAKLAA
jgi:hypothetical protein